MNSDVLQERIPEVKYTPSARGIVYFGAALLAPPLIIYILAFLKTLFNPPLITVALAYLGRLPIALQLLMLLVFPLAAFVIAVVARIKKEHPRTSIAVMAVSGLFVAFIVFAALRSPV